MQKVLLVSLPYTELGCMDELLVILSSLVGTVMPKQFFLWILQNLEENS